MKLRYYLPFRTVLHSFIGIRYDNISDSKKMIRTRDFAKVKFSRSTESLVSPEKKNFVKAGVSADTVVRDADVISLSSCEDKPLVTPKTEPKSRKKRERKPKVGAASVRNVRKWKTPLKANYAKITDYFQKTKNDVTTQQRDTKAMSESDRESGVAPMDDSDVEIVEVVPSTSSIISKPAAQHVETTSENQNKDSSTSATTVLKQLKVVLERMDMTPYINGEVVPMNMRKRRIPSDQSKLDGFVDCKTNNVGYFDTYRQSSLLPLPDNSMVRIDCVEMTKEKIKLEPMATDDIDDAAVVEPAVANIISSPKHITENEENDKNVENISSVIVDNSPPNVVANEIIEPIACNEVIANEENASKSGQSSLLMEQITSIRPSMSTYSDCSSKNVDVNQNHTEKYIKRRKTKEKPQTVIKKQTKKKMKTANVPSYKIIKDTKLAVDAFRYGDIEGVQHYFLSHFHADHYIGLKKSFSAKLYLSEITGRLVHEFIKVDKKYMHYMVLQKPMVVEDVEVTALDANHCPGAVMFLFKLTTGKCILHTGDFRASPDMEEYPEFWNNSIDCIYLDTTYLSKNYAFQSQNESIAEAKSECREFLKKNETVGKERCLIVCGAYKIGKEKVWMSIADEFDFKVYIDKDRRKAMECLGDANVLSKLTPNPNEGNIHVLPLGKLNYEQMSKYLQYYNDTFNVLLAVRPSGWEKETRKPKYTGNISLLGVQYSEHSSYNELERFIKYLQPKEVISTVPKSHQNVEKTTEVPAAWTNITTPMPKREQHQPTIKDMFRKNNRADNTRSVAKSTDTRSVAMNAVNVNEDIEPTNNDDSKSRTSEEVHIEVGSSKSNSNAPESNANIFDISSDTDYMT